MAKPRETYPFISSGEQKGVRKGPRWPVTDSRASRGNLHIACRSFSPSGRPVSSLETPGSPKNPPLSRPYGALSPPAPRPCPLRHQYIYDLKTFRLSMAKKSSLGWKPLGGLEAPPPRAAGSSGPKSPKTSEKPDKISPGPAGDTAPKPKKVTLPTPEEMQKDADRNAAKSRALEQEAARAEAGSTARPSAKRTPKRADDEQEGAGDDGYDDEKDADDADEKDDAENDDDLDNNDKNNNDDEDD